MQRALHNDRARLHVAIIMDGNGRWATARGLPRSAGHAAGAHAVRRIVEAAARREVGTLTLYAFSGDNWRRPASEVAALLQLFERYLGHETARCVRTGIALEIIGRRDRLPPTLLAAIREAERATAHGRAMRLRIALDYSARDAVAAAAVQVRSALPAGADAHGADALDARERFARALADAMHASAAPDVDLLIRTGGERRLSDFLLWECAYAELLFVDALWPDFGARALDAALADFARRERRFGALPGVALRPTVVTSSAAAPGANAPRGNHPILPRAARETAC